MAAPPAPPVGRGASPTARRRPDDLVACAGIWRDSINDYTGRLEPARDPRRPRRRSCASTPTSTRPTPTAFVVAEQAVDGGPPAVVAFAASYRREDAVVPLDAVRAARRSRRAGSAGRCSRRSCRRPRTRRRSRATATDSVQPISNGLYASLGIAPRMPLLRLVGLPERDGRPAGRCRAASRRSGSTRWRLDGRGGRRTSTTSWPRSIARRPGFDTRGRPRASSRGRGPDRLPVRRRRRPGRRLRLCRRRPAGSGRSPSATRRCSGRSIGQLAAAGRAARRVRDLGAGRGRRGDDVPLLRAGFRVDGFPVLLCWDRPFADFSRYVPISPGLL